MSDGPDNGPDDGADRIAASLDAPLVVVTVAARGRRDGCLVGFHTQSSIEPFHYAVWLSKANLTYDLALFSDRLAVHFLTAADEDLAALFGTTSGDETDKLARCDTETGPDGLPLLARCPNRMVVRRVATFEAGGDHVCFVTVPEEVASAGRFEPLRLASVADLEPGHEAGERRGDRPR